MSNQTRRRRRRGNANAPFRLIALAAAAAATAASARTPAAPPLRFRLPAPVALGVRRALSRAGAGGAPPNSASCLTATATARRDGRAVEAAMPSSVSSSSRLENCGLNLHGEAEAGEERRYDVLDLDNGEGVATDVVLPAAAMGGRGMAAVAATGRGGGGRRGGGGEGGARTALIKEEFHASSVAPSSSISIRNVVSASSSSAKAAAAATPPTAVSAGGASAALAVPVRPLRFWENMICGAVSRSVAQTVMHPANTMKTILQSNRGAEQRQTVAQLMRPSNFKLLSRGAGAQLLLSIPHGAVNFAVLEYVRRRVTAITENREVFGVRLDNPRFGAGWDFLSSCVSTVCCSVVSTPQMMVTDNIMAGTYPNLPMAVKGLAGERGIKGFYAGWWPGLAGKIPSYALTWTFFQQLKLAQLRVCNRPPKDIENSIMGCMASATTVCIMIPMDTIKTRLVTQMRYPDLVPYKGVIDCGARILKEEGIGAFYRGLTPRLVSVVPMIGIQFGVYEFAKKAMLARAGGAAPEARVVKGKETAKRKAEIMRRLRLSREHRLEEVVMEVAADDDQPFPAPLFHQGEDGDEEEGGNGKSKAKAQVKAKVGKNEKGATKRVR